MEVPDVCKLIVKEKSILAVFSQLEFYFYFIFQNRAEKQHRLYRFGILYQASSYCL